MTTPRQRAAGASLLSWVAVVALVLGLAGSAWLLARNDEQRKVVVATRNLPAFTVVRAGDVQVRSVSRDEVPSGALTAPAAVIGHFLLRGLDGKAVVRGAVVGEKAGHAARDAVLTLDADGTNLQDGEHVDLLFAPTDEHTRAVLLHRALVVHASATQVVVAVPNGVENQIAGVVGRAKLLMTPAS
jgi:hypothetical protein